MRTIDRSNQFIKDIKKAQLQEKLNRRIKNSKKTKGKEITQKYLDQLESIVDDV
jgi:hypothetical protein